MREPDRRPGYRLIFRPYFTTKTGKKVWAHWNGKKVFAFWVKE